MQVGPLLRCSALPSPRVAAALGPLSLLAALGAFGPGCAPSTNDLDVGVSIQDASFTVAAAALGTQLAGSFSLKLTLGQLASTGSDVDIQTFALVRVSDGMVLESPLDIGANAPKSVHVDIGMSQLVVFNVAPKLVAADKLAQFCSGPVQVNGAVFDGARGKTTPVSGPSFMVAGCTP